MKLSRSILILTLALAGEGVFAQTNNNVPKESDYGSFSKFIAQRNIFDPNRQPHYTSTRTRSSTRTRTRTSPGAPAFTLVGTMAYEKGLFAFFSGNSDELKKVLPANGTIAGYTVTQVANGRVTIESADKKEKLELKVGDVMRQESGKWAWSGQGEVPSGGSSPTTSSSNENSSSDSRSSPAPSSPALENNDILKRLMEQRAKENQ